MSRQNTETDRQMEQGEAKRLKRKDGEHAFDFSDHFQSLTTGSPDVEASMPLGRASSTRTSLACSSHVASFCPVTASHNCTANDERV